MDENLGKHQSHKDFAPKPSNRCEGISMDQSKVWGSTNTIIQNFMVIHLTVIRIFHTKTTCQPHDYDDDISVWTKVVDQVCPKKLFFNQTDCVNSLGLGFLCWKCDSCFGNWK